VRQVLQKPMNLRARGIETAGLRQFPPGVVHRHWVGYGPSRSIGLLRRNLNTRKLGGMSEGGSRVTSSAPREAVTCHW
jgi:hypothetical protein